MTPRLVTLGGMPLLACATIAHAQTAPTSAPAVRAIPIGGATGTAARSRRQRPEHIRSIAEKTVAAANRAATRAPATAGFADATQVYPFAQGALYQAYTAPGRVTDIVLEPGEALVAVAAGDTARWVIGDTTSGSDAGKRTHVLVKPVSANLATNVVITTDRRSYHLALTSTPATAMVAVSWTYPHDALIALERAADAQRAAAPVAAGITPDQLRFDYTISGDRPAWRPLRAFDDGRRTYIEFPATLAVGEAPPLFVIGQDGEAQLVNYRVAGRYYVVDRLFGAAELRLGGKRQKVVRITSTESQQRARRRVGRES